MKPNIEAWVYKGMGPAIMGKARKHIINYVGVAHINYPRKTHTRYLQQPGKVVVHTRARVLGPRLAMGIANRGKGGVIRSRSYIKHNKLWIPKGRLGYDFTQEDLDEHSAILGSARMQNWSGRK